MPISLPVPTVAIGGHLVKTSASLPMPTSRYCDQAPCSIRCAFRRIAASEPGTILDRSVPIRSVIMARIASRLAGIAARLLLDHALEHAGREGDAAGLDRLQIAGRQQPGQARVAPVVGAVGEDFCEIADPRCPRCAPAPPGRRRSEARSPSARRGRDRTRRRRGSPRRPARADRPAARPGRSACRWCRPPATPPPASDGPASRPSQPVSDCAPTARSARPSESTFDSARRRV